MPGAAAHNSHAAHRRVFGSGADHPGRPPASTWANPCSPTCPRGTASVSGRRDRGKTSGVRAAQPRMPATTTNAAPPPARPAPGCPQRRRTLHTHRTVQGVSRVATTSNSTARNTSSTSTSCGRAPAPRLAARTMGVHRSTINVLRQRDRASARLGVVRGRAGTPREQADHAGRPRLTPDTSEPLTAASTPPVAGLGPTDSPPVSVGRGRGHVPLLDSGPHGASGRHTNRFHMCTAPPSSHTDSNLAASVSARIRWMPRPRSSAASVGGLPPSVGGCGWGMPGPRSITSMVTNSSSSVTSTS